MDKYSMLTARDMEILKRVKEMSFVKYFAAKTWKYLSNEDRLELLYIMEEFLADVQGRKSRKIILADERLHPIFTDKRVVGLFDLNMQESKNFYINCKSIYNNYQALAFIIHEGRHALEEDLLLGEVCTDGYSQEKIDLWWENLDCNDGYYMPSQDFTQDNHMDYWGQPLEHDANWYQTLVINALGKHFYLDARFHWLIMQENRRTVSYRKKLTKKYGENYSEEILRRIQRGEIK